jgi:cation diffusion facilitator family transporter
VLYAALAANVMVTISKFVATAITGSAGMFSESVHSLVDVGNSGLMLYGVARSRQAVDRRFPFGRARELYFWSFVVGVLIFGLGAGLSLYEGALKLLHRAQPEHSAVAFAVLAVAALFEGASFLVAWRRFAQIRRDETIWRAIVRSKDPRNFLVLLEDSAAIFGLLLVFLGLLIATYTPFWQADAIASICIGLVLAIVALVIARESKSLLIGESADPEIVKGIEAIVRADPRIEHLNEALTMQLGPSDILLNLSVEFCDSLSTGDLEAAIADLDRSVRRRFPAVKRIFIEAEAAANKSRA